MKKVINLALIIGTIVSGVIALKLSAVPVAGFLPEWAKTFWITSPETQQQYILIYDLSVGFLLSAMFYFMVEELPEKTRQFRAKKMIRKHMNWLLQNMEMIISLVIAHYGIKSDLRTLAQKDFLFLDGKTDRAAEEISYGIKTYKGKEQKNTVRKYGTINSIVKEGLGEIAKKIAAIQKYEYFYARDDSFVEYLRRLESCRLLSWYIRKKEPKEDEPCFRMGGSSLAMEEFVLVYRKLKGMKYHDEVSITTIESQRETDEYRKKRETGAYFQYMRELQKKREALAFQHPAIMIYGQEYYTGILVSHLKDNRPFVCMSVNQIQVEQLKHFEYVILFLDDETIPRIPGLIQAIPAKQKLILLTEQKIVPKYFSGQFRKSRAVLSEIGYQRPVWFNQLPLVWKRKEPSLKKMAELIKKLDLLIYGEPF